MNPMRQIVAITIMNIRSMPRRMAASLVIVVGIAGTVVVLVSFLTMARSLERTIDSSGRQDRAIVLRRGSDSEGGSTLTSEATQIIMSAPGIRKTAEGKPIASPEVVETIALDRKGDGARAEVTLRGVSSLGFVLRPEEVLIAGRSLHPGVRELLVGKAARSQYKGVDIGDRVTIRDQEWTVVGAYSSGGDFRESELAGDADVIKSAYGSSIYNSVTVQLQSSNAFTNFSDSLTNNQALAVSVMREQDYYKQQSQKMNMLLSVTAYLVGSIMALGAMFGALSTMYSTVSSRTAEIATLRAIGFGPAGVVISVLTESLILALIGGLAGALLTWTVFNGHTISTLQGGGQVVAQLRVDAGIALVAITWALVIGLVGGSFPAWGAARKSVASALRST
jgi:putative ABC transport system permease protein